MLFEKILLSSFLLFIFASSSTARANKEDAASVAAENKKLALEFVQDFFGDKNIQAIDKYIGETYIQHNHEMADGREALKKAAEVWFKDDNKKEKVDVRRVAADGDLVWIHSKAHILGKDMAIVDIVRFDKGKIVEHWSVEEEVPTQSANQNTVF